MHFQFFKLEVSVGKVSAKYMAPDKPICILTLAHGAGAGMDHSFMETLADSLAGVGIATLRFNLPFAEHKKFRPDSPAIAHATIEAAVKKARELTPKLPLFALQIFRGKAAYSLAGHRIVPLPALFSMVFHFILPASPPLSALTI
jgi:predicted alpha/beta-hydrolase family hydrolase